MDMNKNRNMTLSCKHKWLVSGLYGSNFHDLQRFFMKNFIRFRWCYAIIVCISAQDVLLVPSFRKDIIIIMYVDRYHYSGLF